VFSAAFIFDQAADTTNREGAPPLSRTLRKGGSWQHGNRPRARPESERESPPCPSKKRRDKRRAPSGVRWGERLGQPPPITRAKVSSGRSSGTRALHDIPTPNLSSWKSLGCDRAIYVDTNMLILFRGQRAGNDLDTSHTLL
jgi:hypothetical protein